MREESEEVVTTANSYKTRNFDNEKDMLAPHGDKPQIYPVRVYGPSGNLKRTIPVKDLIRPYESPKFELPGKGINDTGI